MGTRLTVVNRIESTYQTITTQLFVTDCFECGVVFAIPKTLEDRRRADGKTWYCPNGHGMVFRETELDKTRKRAEQAERARDRARRELDAALDDAQHQRRRAAAARGQLTKMRNRVARGLCPDMSCKRSFTNLHNHVRTCHPDLLEAIGGES